MQGSDISEFADLRQELEQTRVRLADLQAEYDAQKVQLNEARVALAEITREVVPTALEANMFPPGLIVKSFVKGEHLKLSVTGTTLVERGIVALFGLVWTGGVSSMLLGLKLPIYVVVAAFLTVYWFLFLRPQTINFDFRKRKITIAGKGGIAWLESQPVVIETVNGKVGGAAILKLGPRRIVRFPEERSSEAAAAKVEEFVRALNWQMGVPTLTGGATH